MLELLVNLETGETMDADVIALRERGLPDGWKVIHDVTTEEWLLALRAALSASRSSDQ